MSQPRRTPGVLRIGLTGGIASGKSEAAAGFAALGVPILDSDAIARELVEPGQPAQLAIAQEFGPELFDSHGRLDRRRLRDQVFADPEQRKRLEQVLHPRVAEELARRSERTGGPYQVWVIPLLVETGMMGLVDRVLVIDCPEAAQLERLSRRDGETATRARRILAAQASRAERLAHADDVIVNDAGLEHLEREVRRLHARYLG